MAERTPRINEIVKVKASNFSISVLKDIITKYLENGTYAWTKIKDTPKETVFKVPNFVNGEYGYFGMKYDEIRVGTSYIDWLTKPKNLRSQIAYNPNCVAGKLTNLVQCISNKARLFDGEPLIVEGINRVADPEDPVPDYGDTEYWFDSYKEYTIRRNAEQFDKDSDVLFFSMFKQYDEGIDWKDFLGAERLTTCSKKIQYDKSGGSLKGGGSGAGGGETYYEKPPLYPGVGFPAIGSEPDYYKKHTKSTETVLVYLSRTKHNASVYVNYRDTWEMAQFGFFEPFDTVQEYPFPALVMSSNIGSKPLAEFDSRKDAMVTFLLYDYSQKNTSMCHAMPCCTSSYGDETGTNLNYLNEYGSSQIQVMIPKGQWKSIINLGLSTDNIYDKFKELGPFFSYKEPDYVETKNFCTVFHTDVTKTTHKIDLINGISWADLDATNLDEIIGAEEKLNITLQPLVMFSSTEENFDQNVLGVIPATYWCSFPIKRYGVYKKGNKWYLILPNIKENRPWHVRSPYAFALGRERTMEDSEKEQERIDKISKTMNTAFYIGENVGVSDWV